MKNLYVISLDMVGSGADDLAATLQESQKTEKEYIGYLVKNNLTGFVNVEKVQVEDEDFQNYLDNPELFFDADDNGTRKAVSRTRVFHGVKTAYNPHSL